MAQSGIPFIQAGLPVLSEKYWERPSSMDDAMQWLVLAMTATGTQREKLCLSLSLCTENEQPCAYNSLESCS